MVINILIISKNFKCYSGYLSIPILSEDPIPGMGVFTNLDDNIKDEFDNIPLVDSLIYMKGKE